MSDEIIVRQPRLLLKEIDVDGIHLKESFRLHPEKLSFDLNARLMSTASMTLPETDPDLAIHDLVELYTPNGSAGIFWVVCQEPEYGKNRAYKLNHAVDILSAAVYPGNPAGDETYSGSVSGFISELLAAQTQKIGSTSFWQLGTCADSGTWYKEIAYDNVLEDLSEIEKNHDNYHFVFNFNTFPWTLSLESFTDDVLSEFRIGRNTTKVKPSINDSDLCTRLYLSVTTKTPVTQDGSSVGNKETQEFYTFDYAAGQQQYGVICRSAGIESDKVPNTQAFVDEYFRIHGTPGLSLTLDGEEYIRLTGEPIDEAKLGCICRVAIPQYTVLFSERIFTVRYPDVIKTPRKISVNMANKRNTLEGSIASVKKETATASRTATTALRASNNNATEINRQAAHFNHEVHETNEGLSDCFSVIGVKIGDDGMPMRDEHGDYVWAGPNDSPAEIWGHLHRNAWTQVIQNHIQDEQGNILSIGQVLTSADGQALITAINNNATGQAQILADRIAIQSTSGSGITFDNQGNISINAGEVVTRINNQSENIIDINADRILIGSNRTLNSILGINSEGGYAYFTGQVGFFNSSQSAASLVTINNGKVNAPTLQVANEGSLIFGALGNNSITLTHQILGSMVRSFSVSGNVLTLTPFVGEAVNFSKATTLTGAWSSGVYTVTATPQGNTESTQIYLGATGNGSSNFSVNTYHDSIAAANIAISDYIYLTEEVAAKTVSAHWHNAQGTVYGVISTQATYNAGSSSVTLNNPDWGTAPNPLTNSRTVSVWTSGRVNSNGVSDELHKDILVTLQQGNWSNNHKMIVGLQSIGAIRAQTEVDASGIYYAGWNSAASAVSYPGTASGQVLNATLTLPNTGASSSTPAPTKDVLFRVEKSATPSANAAVTAQYSTNNGSTYTKFLRINVGNMYTAGWDAASALTVSPSAGTGTSFVFIAPTTTTDQQGNVTRAQTTFTFNITKGATPGSSGYAAVEFGGIAVGRISIGDWYDAGQGSVSAGIVDGNNNPVSGRQTLSAGSSITLYPAKYISGAYDSKNTQAAVVVTAGTPSSWINMTSSEISNADLGPNGLDRVRISNSQSDNGSGAITVNATNYIWLLGSDGNWGVARSVNISANITTSAGNISSSNPYPSATLYGVTQGNYLPISITCGNSTIHIVVKGT